MGYGRGYGKTILYGEHFVVYGLPAVASAIDMTTTATVRRADTPGWHLIDDRPTTPPPGKGMMEQARAIERILNHLGIDPQKQGLVIRFRGELAVASGLGASAASCVALVRALNQEFNLRMNDETVNSTAFEGEKEYHGTPSGIDNTIATYGGVIWFKRNLRGGANIMDRVRVGAPMSLVIGDTGVSASTGEVVDDVRRRREKHPQMFQEVFKKYESLALEARKAIEKGDLEEVGRLMNENQECLRRIGVSSPELEDLIESALNQGAYGAKLTGKGRGGSMIALTPGRSLQEKVYRMLVKRGFNAWKTTIRG